MEKKSPKKRMQHSRIQSIFKMHELGRSNRYIARECRCSASTVHDTLNKYRHPDDGIWNGMNSYEKSKYVWDMQKSGARQKNRFRGHVRDVEKQEYIIEKLVNEEWSPEIISAKMPEDIGKSVSVNTIYRFVRANGRELKKHLYEKGKKRKQRVSHRRGRFHQQQGVPKRKYIDERPENITSREEFGHWEGDLVVGPQRGSKYVILSLIERKTRAKEFIRMPNRKADTTLGHLRAFFMSLPVAARKSITLDNGVEFSPSRTHKLEQVFSELQVYYTEPYSPQQKGSNEHMNGRFRRAFPKKTDFAFVPKQEIKRETQRLNNRPMKLHGFRTPQEMFDRELELAQEALKLAA